MKTERVEAFSDGVFAVAITLLVLDLAPTTISGGLLTALADRWPNFAAFALSFVIIGIVWVNHHALLGTVRLVDRPLLFLNLFLLMSVVLIPFSTSLFARYLVRGGGDSHLAAAVFSGSALLMAVGFALVHGWISRHPDLWRAQGEHATVGSRLRFALGIVVYAAAIGISFVSAIAVFFIQLATAAYYVVDQLAGAAPAES
jgi:uncharacterized membrane protein